VAIDAVAAHDADAQEAIIGVLRDRRGTADAEDLDPLGGANGGDGALCYFHGSAEGAAGVD
jgi:hypothetical protein